MTCPSCATPHARGKPCPTPATVAAPRPPAEAVAADAAAAEAVAADAAAAEALAADAAAAATAAPAATGAGPGVAKGAVSAGDTAVAATLPTPRGATPAAEPLPDLGPKFRVLRRIAQGGMGALYAAEHVGIGRVVAVKRIAGGGDDPGLVRRLRREAHSAGRLGHPNIVAVSDFDTAPDGSPYLVMELLSGEDLRARLRARTRLPPGEAVAIAGAVARGLHAAHQAGIVHRDVKPENVFLVRDGERETPKLLDFGVAHLREAAGTLTVGGALIGTPAYLAPEQARGDPVDARTDVYALALLTYELLTGRRPFDAGTLDETLARIVTLHPPPPSRAGAPPEAARLDEVVARGLDKNPAHRWPSALAFAEALETAWRGGAVPGGSGARWRRRLRSRRLRAAALGAAVLAAAAGVWAWTRGARLREAAALAEDAAGLYARGDLGKSDLAVRNARRAVELAPGLATAHAVLGNALIQRARFEPSGRRRPMIEQGLSALRRAQAIDLRDPHAQNGMMRYLNFQGRQVDRLRLGLEIARRAGRADWGEEARGTFAYVTGRPDRARAAHRDLAGRPDPERWSKPVLCRLDFLDHGVAWMAGRMRDPAADRAVTPSDRCWYRVLAGDLGGVRALRLEVEGWLDLTDRAAIDAGLAAAEGRAADARAHLADLRARVGEQDQFLIIRRNGAVQLAQAAAFAGDLALAAQAAALAADLGYSNADQLRRDPTLAALRSDPAFAGAVSRVADNGDRLWSQAVREGLVR